MPQEPPISRQPLRGVDVCQSLHWLATGHSNPEELCAAYLDAAERLDPLLNAYVDLRPELARDQASAAARRRAEGVMGRLDGIPVAVKDNIDIAGWPTRAGLPGRERCLAHSDAQVVSRLRAAGAVLVGKTNMDEGALGATTNNPHFGATQNPFRHGFTAGGSSGGSAAAVAAGLAAAAIGTDSLGSVRIPASYCGLCALKPTHGEISTRGVVPAARRLDAVGILTRSVADLTVFLQILAGYDAEDPRSRRRRVALAVPNWEPGRLRSGVLADLTGAGVESGVADLFNECVARLEPQLGQQHPVDFSDWPLGSARRAGLLLMEAEMCQTWADERTNTQTPISPAFRRMLDWAAARSAPEYVAADRVLDAARLKARRMFAQIDVLITPTTPQTAFPLEMPAPNSQADLTGFASLAACPAVSIPMGLVDGLPVGMQFVGPPGSDLRLLELAGSCAATLDATPDFPLEPSRA